MGVATWKDWQRGGWSPQQFSSHDMSTKLVARMRAAPKSESLLSLRQLLGLLKGQGFVQYSACNTDAALGSARALLGEGGPPAAHVAGRGHGASSLLHTGGQLSGGNEMHVDIAAHSHTIWHAGGGVVSQTQVRGKGAAPPSQSWGLLGPADLSGQLAPADSSYVITLQRAAAGPAYPAGSGAVFSRHHAYPERLAAWARQALGYKALGSHCSLLARKFPASEMPAALQMGLSCAGIGIGAWCEHNQPLQAAASTDAVV
jgi:hypothetical protein